MMHLWFVRTNAVSFWCWNFRYVSMVSISFLKLTFDISMAFIRYGCHLCICVRARFDHVFLRRCFDNTVLLKQSAYNNRGLFWGRDCDVSSYKYRLDDMMTGLHDVHWADRSVAHGMFWRNIIMPSNWFKPHHPLHACIAWESWPDSRNMFAAKCRHYEKGRGTQAIQACNGWCGLIS